MSVQKMMMEQNDLSRLFSRYFQQQDEEKWLFELKAWERYYRSYLRDLKLSPVYGRVKRCWSWLNQIDDAFRQVNDSIPKWISAWHGWPPQARYEKDPRFWDLHSENMGFVLQSIQPVVSGLMDEAAGLKWYSLEQIDLQPVGIVPLKPVQGFVLLPKNVNVYGVFYYKVHHFFTASQHLAIDFVPYGIQNLGPSCSLHDVRWRLIRDVPQRAQMSVFVLNASLDLPYWHTLRPLAKKKLEIWVQNYSAGVKGAS